MNFRCLLGIHDYPKLTYRAARLAPWLKKCRRCSRAPWVVTAFKAGGVVTFEERQSLLDSGYTNEEIDANTKGA